MMPWISEKGVRGFTALLDWMHLHPWALVLSGVVMIVLIWKLTQALLRVTAVILIIFFTIWLIYSYQPS